MQRTEVEALQTAHVWSRALRLATVAVILIGALARINVGRWAEPWSPHQPDEHILPLEALALWEGITPREVGWPGSTTRLVLSVVAASQCLRDQGRAMWAERAHPDRALQIVSTWIGNRYVDRRPLYRMGRTISVVTGILQLVAVVWALSQWVGPVGTLIGTLAIALSPVTVAYSQYVLADIAGLLFGTIAMGLAARPTSRRLIAMAALIGLAASSKFHFGLWLLTPLLCVWMGDRKQFPRKRLLSLGIVLTVAWVLVAFVPWFLIDPLLALKEFAGVVLVKIGHGSRLGGVTRNSVIIFTAFGVLGWCGVLASAGGPRAQDRRRFGPIAIPLMLATSALVLSATVFDRYAIVLLPGAVILTGLGWDEWLAHPRPVARRAAAVALAVALLVTTTSLVRAQRVVGEADVDVLVRNWLVEHVSPGSRIALHDEANAYLPRTQDELRACVEYVTTVSAYQEKWLVEGAKTSADHQRPMESMVLNDERFNAYWCRRELDMANSSGFQIVTYHAEPRFSSVLERDAVNDFRTGAHLSNGQADVLVMNRTIDVGVPPAEVFETARGKRVIYRR